MLFNSFEFMIFLPIVFLLYWWIFKSFKQQNLLIVASSYLFYGWWDWRFLFLIGFTTFCSYLSGVLLERNEGKRRNQKLISVANITLNLLILLLFKYFNFFRENLQRLFDEFGVQLDWVTLDILLPIGISFYTFQALSYTIDVYQHKIKATHDPVAFFAFISFFPQLVAGPIERATNLLPQFLKPRRFDYDQAVDGMRLILWGLFKKLVIADNCAFLVNHIFDNASDVSGTTLLIGALFFTFQIYGDFSGYSDIAIGTARLFGISLTYNFKTPYFSRNIAEFWKRWHISLSNWFRDYIYIPLGGSRTTKAKVIRNTLIVFLISGLWHGANWTFILWGLYHALLFIPSILVHSSRKHTNVICSDNFLSFREIAQMIVTFILVVFGWIIFRANDLQQAFYIIRKILFNGIKRPELPTEAIQYQGAVTGIIILILLEWLNRKKQHGLEISGYKPFVRRILYIILFLLIIYFTGEIQTFIYFQF